MRSVVRVLAGITRLELQDNNLQGVVPQSLATLQALKVLNLSKNRLIGEFPNELLVRADSNLLDCPHVWGNALANLLTQVSISSTASVFAIQTCNSSSPRRLTDRQVAPSIRVRIAKGPRAVSRAYCLKAEGSAPPLDDASRALRRLAFASAGPRYYSPGGVSDHEEFVRTAITWGSGVSQVVRRSAGQAPIDFWIGQQLLLGLVPEQWERTAESEYLRIIEMARRVICAA